MKINSMRYWYNIEVEDIQKSKDKQPEVNHIVWKVLCNHDLGNIFGPDLDTLNWSIDIIEKMCEISERLPNIIITMTSRANDRIATVQKYYFCDGRYQIAEPIHTFEKFNVSKLQKYERLD